jgi:hypothetical protein
MGGVSPRASPFSEESGWSLSKESQSALRDWLNQTTGSLPAEPASTSPAEKTAQEPECGPATLAPVFDGFLALFDTIGHLRRQLSEVVSNVAVVATIGSPAESKRSSTENHLAGRNQRTTTSLSNGRQPSPNPITVSCAFTSDSEVKKEDTATFIENQDNATSQQDTKETGMVVSDPHLHLNLNQSQQSRSAFTSRRASATSTTFEVLSIGVKDLLSMKDLRSVPVATITAPSAPLVFNPRSESAPFRPTGPAVLQETALDSVAVADVRDDQPDLSRGPTPPQLTRNTSSMLSATDYLSVADVASAQPVSELQGTVAVDASGSAVLCQFEILAELGKGSFGRVYLVVDSDGDLYALKTLHHGTRVRRGLPGGRTGSTDGTTSSSCDHTSAGTVGRSLNTSAATSERSDAHMQRQLTKDSVQR